MHNDEFAKLLVLLRKNRAGRLTQQGLAKKTQIEGQKGLTAKQIADLEQGKVAHIRPEIHLEPLARALQLTEEEQISFYAKAGLVYSRDKPKSNGRGFVDSLLKGTFYPASAKNALWDIMAFNAYHCALWGYAHEKLDRFKKHKLSPNLLCLLFDPALKDMASFGQLENDWKNSMIRAIRYFRESSFPHIYSPRYRQIFEGIKSYPYFNEAWEHSHSPDFEVRFRRATITVYHPELGVMEFLSLRVPPKAVGTNVDLLIYVPYNLSTENKYQELRSIVENSEDYQFQRFDPPSIE